MKLWVKICGITRPEDAGLAASLGVDAIGVNFCPSSVRRCDTVRAREISAAVPPRVDVFGVFAGAERAEIEALVVEVGLTGVQLHGGEPESLARGWTVPVIRAVFVDSREAVAAVAGARDYRPLLDAPFGGGAGKSIDGRLLEGFDLSGVILAGGLSPANVGGTVRALRPWGVDCASGVESEPGIKDAQAMKEFIDNARSA